MKMVVIANPVAGRGRPFRKLQAHVRSWNHPDWNVELLPTQAPGHAGVLARGLLARPPDILAVCGGDGTVNEVVSVLPPKPPFPLAVLPGGTANVLARELGLPLDPVRALDVALAGKVRLVDVGEMQAKEDRRFAFVFVAGIGFDAWAVHLARPSIKAKIGIAAYALAVAECLASYRFPRFEVVANGRIYAAISCLVCNARSYGGGLSFCPDADMADGFLDVLVIKNEGNAGVVCRARLLGLLLSAWISPGRTPTWIERLRARELRVEGPPSVLIETDGELAGALPAKFLLAEKSLPLIAR
ncbi:MAG: diacylglycerol kinase family lipid kinase [Acidobacteriota bacterium]|jgi:YegS/Rv2252/BmrU family lipid kinase|nr:diacylglycerol kinase family lipid kinase [Acidobacteriota bacterium]